MRLVMLAWMSIVTVGSMPTPSRSSRSSCDAGSRVAASLDGRAVDERGQPMASVLVSVSWHSVAADDGSSTGDGRFTITDDRGRWSLCGLPFATMIVRAGKGGLSDATIAVLDSAHLSDSVDLILERHANGGGAPNPIVAITVLNREGEPIDAKIEMATSAGIRRLSATGGQVLAILPRPERIVVNARAIGYKPGSIVAGVDRGTNTLPVIMDAAAVPLLAPVRVLGDREVLARHEEFEERRRLGLATVSITAEEIDRRNPVDAWQMLVGVPSMRVIPYGLGVYAMSNRGNRVVSRPNSTDLNLVPCWYRLMIDGVALPDSMPDLSRLPSPKDIHGIEIFAGPASLPPQYNSAIAGGAGAAGNNSCGLIAIWTK